MSRWSHLVRVGVAWCLLAQPVLACTLSPVFSPTDDVQAAILAEVLQAHTSIDCSLFGVTNLPLSQALERQARAGVMVRVGLDKKQAAGARDRHAALRRAGVQVAIKKSGVLEHNKFCVLDGETVVMGSWNWSASAQAQDNSDLILHRCETVTQAFQEAFARIWARDY